MADLSFGDADFTAISNVNITLQASFDSMGSSSVNANYTKTNTTSINSSPTNSAAIQVQEATAKTLNAALATKLQTLNYDNVITSDTGTTVDAQVAGMSTNIQSTVGTNIDSKAVAKESDSKAKSKESDVKSKSYVIILR